MLLHYAVSMIGGFLGGYAIINHSDIFGNAQTANLIHLVTKIFSGNYIAILPILFVTPVQWNAFREANGYISATIFSTNNLRQATTSLASYLIDRDEKQRDKAKFFWSTLASFHMGVALSCVSSLVLGVESIWFCFIPIMLSATAYVRLEQKNIGFIRKNVSKAEKTI